MSRRPDRITLHNEQDSTVNSTINGSAQDTTDTSKIDGHYRYCTYKNGTCICANLLKFAKIREEHKQRKLEEARRRKQNSESDEEIDKDQSLPKSTTSTESRATSYYSAQNRSFAKATAETSAESTVYEDLFSIPYGATFDITNTDEIDKTYQLPVAPGEVVDVDDEEEELQITAINNENTNAMQLRELIDDMNSKLKNVSSAQTWELIEPILKVMNGIMERESINQSIVDGLNFLQQSLREDPETCLSRLTTIIEESTILHEASDLSIYVQEFSINFKNLYINPKPKEDTENGSNITQKMINRKICKNLIDESLPATFMSPSVCRNLGLSMSCVQSPQSDCSTPNLNDSTFTYLEKKLVGKNRNKSTVSIVNSPSVYAAKAENMRRYEIQLKALEDSPEVVEKSRTNDRLSEKMRLEETNSPRICQLTATKIDEDVVDESVNDSILHEYVTQRQRYLETERTIREIQRSGQNSDVNCKLLNVLSDCPDYSTILKVDSDGCCSKGKATSTPASNRDMNVTIRHRGKEVKEKSAVKTPFSDRKMKPSSAQDSPIRRTRRSVTLKVGIRRSNSKSPSRSPQRRPLNPTRLAETSSRSPSPALARAMRSPNVRKIVGSSSKTRYGGLVPKLVINSPTTVHDSVGTPETNRSSEKSSLVLSPITPCVTRRLEVKKTQPKFFNSPNKTPAPRPKRRVGKFFETPEALRDCNIPSVGQYFGIGGVRNIRSPVGDYIHGIDNRLIKNVKTRERNLMSAEKGKTKLEVAKDLANDENQPVDFNSPSQGFSRKSPKVGEKNEGYRITNSRTPKIKSADDRTKK